MLASTEEAEACLLDSVREQEKQVNAGLRMLDVLRCPCLIRYLILLPRHISQADVVDLREHLCDALQRAQQVYADAGSFS
ncbi:hypothetical protein PTI98_009089 [Pleurotus ostreatus]|nr:hypothetical protein PTI98_009089 [Pleurotus ostreatus]